MTGLDFIRAEGFVFSHVADEGLLNACAGDLLRYRKQIGAEHVKIFTDIKKKHRWDSQLKLQMQLFEQGKPVNIIITLSPRILLEFLKSCNKYFRSTTPIPQKLSVKCR